MGWTSLLGLLAPVFSPVHQATPPGGVAFNVAKYEEIGGGCEQKVKRSVEGIRGVTQVAVERKAHKLTVVGYMDPSKVLARVMHRTGKRVEFWPYISYDVVAHPYVAKVYDRKALSGYVRNVEDLQMENLARASSTEVLYTTTFSDENPAACTVM